MAVKARNFERSNSVEEEDEENDDKVDVEGGGIVEVSPEEEIIPSERYQAIRESARAELAVEPPSTRLADDTRPSHECNGNADTHAHSMNKMAGKLTTHTTYRLPKYYLYAACSVVVAFWIYLIMNRAISTGGKTT